MERWTSVVGDSVSGHVTGQVCVERRLNVPSRGELFKRTPEGGALSPSLGGASGRRRLGTEVSLPLSPSELAGQGRLPCRPLLFLSLALATPLPFIHMLDSTTSQTRFIWRGYPGGIARVANVRPKSHKGSTKRETTPLKYLAHVIREF